MRTRLISAAIIIPIFLLGMLRFPVSFRLFMVAALLLGFEEYRRLMAARGWGFAPWLGMGFLLALTLPVALGASLPVPLGHGPGAGLALSAALITASLWRIGRTDLANGFPKLMAELGGLLYLGLLGLQLIHLHALPQGGYWVLVVFSYAWVYDAGALFVGKSLGKRPFSPISPKKTWEGFFGGIGVNMAFSALVLPLLLPDDFPLTRSMAAGLAFPASVLAQGGDLMESMIKRYSGQKDSSSLIAGQGGFLDKMDSSLFVAPLVYAVALWLGA